MLLKDLARKFKTAQIITHDDLDGYGSGAILVKTLKLLGFENDNIEVTHTNYANPLPFNNNHKFIIISDISISTADAAKKLMDFVSDSSNLVIWIDHHKTSIDFSSYSSYSSLQSILGIRNTNASGTLLCWLFHQKVNFYLGCDKASLTNDIFAELNDDYIAHSLNSDSLIEIPYPIRLVDDYDRFVMSYDNSKYFIEAFNNYPAFEKNCKSEYFQTGFMNSANPITGDYIHRGKLAFIWRRIAALNALKSRGFIASLFGEGLPDMICLNSADRGSLTFGKCLGDNSSDLFQYNYACLYNHNGDKYNVSIYCANPKNASNEDRRINHVYDATDICKRFNGGGHPGAAGFIATTLHFVNIRPLPETIKIQIDEEITELWKKAMPQEDRMSI